MTSETKDNWGEADARWMDIQQHATRRGMDAIKRVVDLAEPHERSAMYSAVGLECFIHAAAWFSAASGTPGPESPAEAAATAANYMRAMASIIETDPEKYGAEQARSRAAFSKALPAQS